MDGSARSTCRLEATGGTGRDSSVSEGCATTDSEVGAPGGAVAPMGSARRTRAARQRCTNTTMPAATTEAPPASQIGKPLDPDEARTSGRRRRTRRRRHWGTDQGRVRWVAEPGGREGHGQVEWCGNAQGRVPCFGGEEGELGAREGAGVDSQVPVVRSPGTTNEYVASKSPSSALPFPVVSPASLTVAVTGEPPVGVKVTEEPGNAPARRGSAPTWSGHWDRRGTRCRARRTARPDSTGLGQEHWWEGSIPRSRSGR